jgi:hypothetical protein
MHKETLKHAHAHASVDFVLSHVIEHHFPANEDIAFFSSNSNSSNITLAWKNVIIGKGRRASQLDVADIPSLVDLQYCIRVSLEFSCKEKETIFRTWFFTFEISGKAWWTTIEKTIDYQALYLQGCSAFPDYLRDLLGQHQYLDQLAGVVDLGHPNLDVVARFQQMYDQAPVRHVDKHDLLLGKDSRNEQVLDMAALLNLKGKKELGYDCNCGPTGHKIWTRRMNRSTSNSGHVIWFFVCIATINGSWAWRVVLEMWYGSLYALLR